MNSTNSPAAATAARHPRRETGQLTARPWPVVPASLARPHESRQALTLVNDAVAATRNQRARRVVDEHDRVEATWRERALNAEDGLTQAHNEIRVQRQRIGEFMGQLRDTGTATRNGESVEAMVAENYALGGGSTS